MQPEAWTTWASSLCVATRHHSRPGAASQHLWHSLQQVRTHHYLNGVQAESSRRMLDTLPKRCREPAIRNEVPSCRPSFSPPHPCTVGMSPKGRPPQKRRNPWSRHSRHRRHLARTVARWQHADQWGLALQHRLLSAWLPVPVLGTRMIHSYLPCPQNNFLLKELTAC